MNHVITCLVFLIITTVTTRAQEDKSSNERIVGGTNVPFGTYPWFAKARVGDKWGGCGGILVAKEWVLTAAHCVEDFDHRFPAVEIGAICHDEFDSSIDGNCGQPSQVISTLQTAIHPNYDNYTLDNDFALLKLASSASATPVDMDLSGFVDTYTSETPLWTIGFGRLEDDGNIPARLQHVEIKFVPESTCNIIYDNYIFGVTNNMLCAADPGQSSCYGDSGGPLYDAVNNVLVGVVSWGVSCADAKYPGVYSKIYAQREWIVDTICNNSTIPPSFCSGFTMNPTPAVTPSPTASPTKSASPTALCYDVPYWFDSYGDGCVWYGFQDGRCELSDSFAGTNGLTANEACCDCGGGTTVPPLNKCDDKPGWVDDYGDGCSVYELLVVKFGLDYAYVCGYDGAGPDGQVANQTCCFCGGGTRTCQDDPAFSFVLKNGNRQDCDWFTMNPDKTAARISTYCGRRDVRNACRATCSSVDDPDFTFVLKNGNTQDCDWLTARPKKTAARISTYCGLSDVRNACRKSCGLCQSTCFDDSGFTFVSNYGIPQDCDWLTANPNTAADRISTYCERKDVRSFCKETCGTCA